MSTLQNLVWNAHQTLQIVSQLLRYFVTFLLALMQTESSVGKFLNPSGAANLWTESQVSIAISWSLTS